MAERSSLPCRIGISVGDVTGIGPEVTLKALRALEVTSSTEFLLIGNFDRLCQLNTELGTQLELSQWGEKDGRFAVFDPFDETFPVDLSPGSPIAARAAIAYLRAGAERCLRQELHALVTAPVNKEAIIRSGQPFIGQTEFLSQLAGTERTAMMLLGSDPRGHWLRVALATTHVPLKLVAEQLDQEKIELTIQLASRACADLGLARSRVAVCGLNPHAGEGGELGDEEIRVIAPAVENARKHGLDVAGPLSADTLFYNAYHGHFEAVVAMYHDQGLVPLKMIGFDTGVNWTLGLPFIRTSPDHGTAYDIAGKNRANPSSMMAAIGLAYRLAQRQAA